MTADILTHLALANLAAAAATLLVLALRKPAQRQIGARRAYSLWIIVPVAMLATCAPARTVWRTAPVQTVEITQPSASTAVSPVPPAPRLAERLLEAWVAGAAGFVVVMLYGQYRAIAVFGLIGPDQRGCARAANLACGPALIGLLWPRIVLPADFEARFAPGEQAMILAHERTHLAAGHLWINAAVAVIRALNWFNPLIHLAAHYARVDQELACDAAVMQRYPDQRRAYAQALLKTQLAGMSPPLGCFWPARSPRLITERIQMISQACPGRARLFAGAAVIGALSLSAGLAAWSAEPPVVKTKLVPAPTPMAIAAPATLEISAPAQGAALGPDGPASKSTQTQIASLARPSPNRTAAPFVMLPAPARAIQAAADDRPNAAAIAAAVSAGDVARLIAIRGWTQKDLRAAEIVKGNIPADTDPNQSFGIMVDGHISAPDPNAASVSRTPPVRIIDDIGPDWTMAMPDGSVVTPEMQQARERIAREVFSTVLPHEGVVTRADVPQ